MKHIALFLHDIYFRKRSGRLVFKREDIEKYFFFQKGNLLQIKTNQPEERLGEVLFRLERISRDAHARMDDFVEPNPNIGEVLKNKGLISEQDLDEALVYQLRETTLNTFPFFDAEIVFQESEGPAARTRKPRISIPFLIEYGIRRMAFNPALKVFLAKKVPRLKGRSMAHLLTEEEKKVLDEITGRAPAEKVLAGPRSRRSSSGRACIYSFAWTSSPWNRRRLPRGRSPKLRRRDRRAPRDPKAEMTRRDFRCHRNARKPCVRRTIIRS